MTVETSRQAPVSVLYRHKLAGPVATFFVLTAGAVYTALANPYQKGFFPDCTFLIATGHWCPGCGGLRATHELLRGHFAAAMGMNPVVVLVIIPLIAVTATWWLLATAGVKLPRVRISTRMAWLIPILLGVFWIVRNIPALEPWLAP